MPRTGTFTIASLGGLLLAALIWAMLAPLPEPEPQPGSTLEQRPIASLSQMVLTRYDDRGRPLWELEVDSLDLGRGGLTRGEGATLRLFSFAPDPKTESVPVPILIVEAGAVELEDRSGNLTLSEGVEARAVEAGLEFTTEEARWDAEEGLLYGDDPIAAHAPEGRLSGLGFRYSLETGELTIEHQARLIINLESADRAQQEGGEGIP